MTVREREPIDPDGEQAGVEASNSALDRQQAASDSVRGVSTNDGATSGTRRVGPQTRRVLDPASHVPSESARQRAEAAARRDRIAAERDRAARAREQLAAALDARDERLALETRSRNGGRQVGLDIILRAARDRQHAVASRARAATQRAAAARDRRLAARDRREAARDRRAAVEALALEGFDDLTGALRRQAGLGAIQRELDRTRRTNEPLVVAFVDVDGLKAINDSDGHAVGDEILRSVVGTIRQQLRSYDVIVRYGGDEFICSLSGQDAPGASQRFAQISARLADVAHHATISVGLAAPREHDSLEDLIHRADTAMIEGRARGRR
jgi:diguanylate cyclase (GGDEF)-like protein